MNNSTSSIITIGREYGSAGRQIGQEVAKYFGIKCYDKELLEHAANDSGICNELFENHDEKPTNSFLYSLVMDTYSFGYSSAGFTDMPMNHKVFLAQFEAIKKLAGEGPCVMVGRCADYALANILNTVHQVVNMIAIIVPILLIISIIFSLVGFLVNVDQKNKSKKIIQKLAAAR